MKMLRAGFVRTGILALALTTAMAPAYADGTDKSSLKDAAPAEPAKSDLQITGGFAGTTDYVFRGFSQSASRPAVQANIDVAYKWFYVGAWTSLIDFGRDANFPLLDVAHTEIDLYAGIKPVWGPVTFDIGVIYYVYPRARDGGAFANGELDYVEIKFGASGTVWKDATLAGTVYYSPEYTGKTGDVWTLEGSFTQGLPAVGPVTPSFSALIGYQLGDTLAYRTVFGNGDDSYLYWNAGFSFGFGDRFVVDLRYWDTDIKKDNSAAGFSSSFCTARLFACDERFVATAKVTF